MIIIPTYGRIHQQKTLAQLSDDENICLVVRPCEYRDAMKLYGRRVYKLPASVDTIAATRKHCGLFAEKCGASKFLMMDDDLRLFKRSDGKLAPLTLTQSKMLTRACSSALTGDVASVSLSPRFGNNYVKEDVRYNTRQSQATMYDTAIYNSLDFGTFNYFEDAHRTLQLLQRGYRTATLFNYAIEPGRMNTPGGCSEFRNYYGMREEAERMAAAYPGIVKTRMVDDDKFFATHAQRPDITVSWRKAYTGGKQ